VPPPEGLAGAGGFEPPYGGIKILLPVPPLAVASVMSAPETAISFAFFPPKSDMDRRAYDLRCRHGADMA